jgi:hypothetical protein
MRQEVGGGVGQLGGNAKRETRMHKDRFLTGTDRSPGPVLLH